MCHVCKNREKNMLAFVLWLNIACNMLVFGEENEHCLHNFICWPVATHGHSTSLCSTWIFFSSHAVVRI